MKVRHISRDNHGLFLVNTTVNVPTHQQVTTSARMCKFATYFIHINHTWAKLCKFATLFINVTCTWAKLCKYSSIIPDL